MSKTNKPKNKDKGTFYKATPTKWMGGFNVNNKPRVLAQFITEKYPKGVWYEAYLVGEATQYTVDAMKLMGFNGKSLGDMNRPEFFTPKEVSILVKKETYTDSNGQTKTIDKVTGIWPADGGGVSDEDQASLDTIDLRAYFDASDVNLQRAPKTSNCNPEDYARGLYDEAPPVDYDSAPSWARK